MLFAFVLAALAAPALAAPSTLATRADSVYNLPGDPTYTVPESNLSSAISCPTGNTSPNLVLLVPGTVEHVETLYGDNFAKLLPANGFPFCYLTTPGGSLVDAQITAEYVAYAINALSASVGAPIRVLSHSQGGLDVQWALTFFPSTRAAVRSFVAIGPDFRGTSIGPIVIALENVLSGHGLASFYQQLSTSNFLAALAAHGGLDALVPTTTLRTATDDVVQPETGADASSVLGGALAVNVLVQDLCPLRVDDHWTLVIDTVTQYLALQAFNADSGLADPTALSGDDVSSLCANFLPQFNSVQGVLNITDSILETFITVGISAPGVPEAWATSEPALFDYAL